MIAAYNSGDPYLAFAKQAGAVPEDATKESHAAERELFKTCVLGVQYGMGEETLGAANRRHDALSMCHGQKPSEVASRDLQDLLALVR